MLKQERERIERLTKEHKALVLAALPPEKRGEQIRVWREMEDAIKRSAREDARAGGLE